MKDANISEMASKLAIQSVGNYLSEKLPAPIASQVQSLLGGEGGGGAAGMLGNLMGGGDDNKKDVDGLGDMLGKLMG